MEFSFLVQPADYWSFINTELKKYALICNNYSINNNNNNNNNKLEDMQQCQKQE
jgi:hypothetical protein